nr:EF-Hand 1, calcium-binding site-containing protein [Tanacetum cinerariifolium]
MGLLLLLPQILHHEKSETGHDDTLDKENLKKKLVDLEQKLIHATINVHRLYVGHEWHRGIIPLELDDTQGYKKWVLLTAFNVYLILSVLNQVSTRLAIQKLRYFSGLRYYETYTLWITNIGREPSNINEIMVPILMIITDRKEDMSFNRAFDFEAENLFF